ncbi:hypothetical protein ELQ35_21875 [Peribacillus cavernae]|jgi:hypothetical protein|uniref:Uncharacterized protein n=1 Tax=Peribacillus cavernae TaxID=1674310 RepID=A0A433H7F1_9BACI|nr:hypothetical protein [Peribacillus cavernae]MDQ0219946.1 hypothetical protein [Peribacillus cavernae]RUQ24257.1 hypothetical protein ELQ35_21875 [Peribacillus cavernae]
MLETDAKIHPTIKLCLKHLDVLGTDNKTRQIVYMYMESLVHEFSATKQIKDMNTKAASNKNK